MKDACTRAVDLAVSRSPPQCPDLDQAPPDPDEAEGKTRVFSHPQWGLSHSLRIIA